VRHGPLTTPAEGTPLEITVVSPDNDGGEISRLGERGLIERIRRRLPPPPASLVVAIGDDAAVTEVDRGALQVLTTDALVEGVHFDRRFSSPHDIGYKALAVNVSDVAAMGAAPRLALLSLMLPPSLDVAVIDGIIDGLLDLASATGVTLAGGNITRSPGPLIVDITVTGAVKPRRVLTRGGGRPGDRLYVTGTIGAGVAGLEWLQEHRGQTGVRLGSDRGQTGVRPGSDRGQTGVRPGSDHGLTPDEAAMAECVARYRRPEPRARIGALLGRSRAATACMDLSDGLADAVRQIAEASGTGAIVDASKLPIHPAAALWFAAHGRDAVEASLAGGDDYELLFTVSHRRRGRIRLVQQQGRGIPLTPIGELTTDRAIVVKRGDTIEPMPTGFVHF
jgi:thiamine-monophosphate kinase